MNKTVNDKTKQIYKTTGDKTSDCLGGIMLYAEVLDFTSNIVNRKGADLAVSIIRGINEKLQNI